MENAILWYKTSNLLFSTTEIGISLCWRRGIKLVVQYFLKIHLFIMWKLHGKVSKWVYLLSNIPMNWRRWTIEVHEFWQRIKKESFAIVINPSTLPDGDGEHHSLELSVDTSRSLTSSLLFTFVMMHLKRHDGSLPLPEECYATRGVIWANFL